MWRVSIIGRLCRAGLMFPPEYYLLGDSGYTLEQWLMTPYAAHVGQDPAEVLYNFKHSSARMKGIYLFVCPCLFLYALLVFYYQLNKRLVA